MPKFSRSDHFDGTRFHNVDPAAKERPFSDVWKWYRARRPAVWPRNVVDAVGPLPDTPAPRVMAVTFLGHSSFLVRWGGITLLTDPVFAEHAGPWGVLGPRRVRPPAYPLSQIPRVDLILQSHNHYDHLDLAAHSALARRDAPQVVTPIGNRDYLPRAVRPRTTELDWWEGVDLGNGRKVTVVPAQHFSARTPWDRNRALWGAFILETPHGVLYFGGDSGYGVHFAETGARFPRIDVALIPIGAYEPRWFMRPVHMDPDEALQAHLDLGARKSVAMHFGTFQLTDEAIDEPAKLLAAARERSGVTPGAFVVPRVGETLFFD
jgi:L-ascorbate metabolism protein UlaG (beta-lactamase superfamily)